MGSYLNPGSERFRTSIRSEIYVDKTMLIAQVNRRIRTDDLFDRYKNVRFRDENYFVQVMKDIYSKTKRPFVILIEKWICE